MQEKKNVLIQMKHTPELRNALKTSRLSVSTVPSIDIPGFSLDDHYAATLPRREPRESVEGTEVGRFFTFDARPEVSTYLIRGEVEDEAALNRLKETIEQDPNGVGVFSDPVISTFPVDPSGPVGTHQDVANLLETSQLHSRNMDGSNVMVAIVDTGINMEHLRSKGVNANFDENNSWSPIRESVYKPGNYPVDHGTMCAFDVCIAAPKCTLIDIALLRSTTRGGSGMDGFLSDAVKAYSKLMELIATDEQSKPLVVNNSWGMYHPSWDFPVGDSGNYSDNPDHPFNIIVESLNDAGADILFAAGNCGSECPSRKCKNFTDRPIYGANSHQNVFCVAGVTTNKVRLCYSSQGPGRLDANKPDICAYTHFKGSEIKPGMADDGTSAACPVAAGAIAAIRSVLPPTEISPAQLRNIVRRNCEDIGHLGFDYDHGFGIINVIDVFPLDVPVSEIHLGESISGSLKETDAFAMFKLNVVDALNINLDGPDGVDFDIYVRKGAKPTKTEYDYRGYTGSADENIKIQATGPGDYYIMVNSYRGTGDFKLRTNLE